MAATHNFERIAMEMKSPFSRQKIGLAVLVVSLVLVGVTMSILLYLTLQSVPQVAPARKPGMMRLAWVSLFALAVVLLLLLWALIRVIALRARPHHHQRTEYVDAWALAGKRLETSKADPLDQEEGPDDEGEEDGGGEGGDGGNDRFPPPDSKN
jgi:hypothetical protein